MILSAVQKGNRTFHSEGLIEALLKQIGMVWLPAKPFLCHDLKFHPKKSSTAPLKGIFGFLIFSFVVSFFSLSLECICCAVVTGSHTVSSEPGIVFLAIFSANQLFIKAVSRILISYFSPLS